MILSQNSPFGKLPQGNRYHFHLSLNMCRSLGVMLFAALFYLPVSSTLIFGQGQLVTQEFRFHAPETGEVFFVWGINGWAIAPAEQQPAGTKIKNGTMHTPMSREDDTFIIKLQVPAGTTIDYGFLITRLNDDTVVNIWQSYKDYNTIVTNYDNVIDRVALRPSEALVTQKFRYKMPEAGEVTLVWGVNGWNAVPKKIRPPGTIIENGLMGTLMVRDGDTFIAEVQVPTGSTIDYGFYITKKRDGTTILPVWDGEQPQPLTVVEDRSIELETTISLSITRRSSSHFGRWLIFVAGVVLVCGIIIIVIKVLLKRKNSNIDLVVH